MTREDLKQAITEAIQREHGYTQPGIGDTVMAVVEQYLREQGVGPQ